MLARVSKVKLWATLGPLALVAWVLPIRNWQPVANHPDCVVLNKFLPDSEIALNLFRLPSDAVLTWSGTCADGKAQGQGTLVARYTQDGEPKTQSYEGGMKDGKSHGFGIHVWASGSTYEGGWNGGRPHGSGILVWANGDRYEGGWKNGREHGWGVLARTNRSRYEGGWKNGRRHGQGTLVSVADGRYQGEWKDGQKHGRGVGEGNGHRYGGDWEDGVMHGQGVFLGAEGHGYEGEWRYGMPYGRGIVSNASGERYETRWGRKPRSRQIALLYRRPQETSGPN